MSEGLFSKDALLGPAKRRFATVEIADLGKVRIRSLTEGERSRIETSMMGKAGEVNANKLVDLKCRMIVECVVDDDGNQVFSKTDIDRLRQQDCKVTNDISDAIQSHCGFSKTDLENLEKN